MVNLIWIRPYFLLAFLPLLWVAWFFWKKPQSQQDWHKICDPKLMSYFSQKQVNRSWIWTWILLILSMSMFILALAGPSIQKHLSKTGRLEQANVILLDLSPAILMDDISPSRLERSKLMIQDLLNAYPDFQWGMVVFSKMPFVVTPISSDVNHILNFLPVLKPDILPINGYDVEKAIEQSMTLFKQAHYSSGKIIVFSSQPPPKQFQKLVDKNFQIAWINAFANAKVNENLSVWSAKTGLNQVNQWIEKKDLSFAKIHASDEKLSQAEDIGPYFLFIGMLAFMMIFRKGWFLRLWV
ncbi:MAG TPA: hypothetical protein DCZ80_01875 [Legionellales bacterium]|nr:hypothetical protein [Legionellales bacterium]